MLIFYISLPALFFNRNSKKPKFGNKYLKPFGTKKVDNAQKALPLRRMPSQLRDEWEVKQPAQYNSHLATPALTSPPLQNSKYETQNTLAQI